MTKNKEGKKTKKKRINQQLSPGDGGDVLVFGSDWKINPKYLQWPQLNGAIRNSMFKFNEEFKFT